MVPSAETLCHPRTQPQALVAKRSEQFGLKPLAFDPLTTYPDGTPMERVAFADYKALGDLQSPVERDTVKMLKLGLGV